MKTYLNLGCGANIVKSTKGIKWVNVDAFFEGKGIVKGDLRDLPFDKEYADYILCDQVLEHLPMADVPTVLYEIKRVLKKGGKAVIIVPDFRSAAQQWLSYNWEATFPAVEYQFFSEVLFGNQNHAGEFHQTPFAAGYLHYLLNMVGLKNHQLVFHPKDGLVPTFPGIFVKEEDMTKIRLRNSQISAEIIK